MAGSTILKIAGALAITAAVATGLFLVRHSLAAAAVEREWQTATVQRLGDFGSTESLEILPLIDEAASRDDLMSEHGVAYLIRTDHQTILMDLGWNAAGTDPSPLLHNMRSLGIELADIDAIVISHLHPDHVGGLGWWLRSTFSFGKEQIDLDKRQVYAPAPLSYPNLTPVIAAEPTVISNGVATAGAIGFVDVFPLSLWQPRRAEQALAVNVADRGIVLITGCGHPTLERLVARAQALFDEPVVGIVGGLHYENMSAEDVLPHIQYLQELRPQLVALSPHDSSAAAIEAFRDAFPDVYRDITVGRPITFGQRTLESAGKER
jgi:7,8-dihydropterin-6-yl-methyl-4-(beta-D-ribofuranosyl)aminobenzene 5'-phosphate synthase